MEVKHATIVLLRVAHAILVLVLLRACTVNGLAGDSAPVHVVPARRPVLVVLLLIKIAALTQHLLGHAIRSDVDIKDEILSRPGTLDTSLLREIISSLLSI